MKRYYLAYGSNLNKGQMSYRCPGAIPVGVAFIKGYRLLFKGSKTGAFLTIEPSKKDLVPVGVWLVNEEHERSLDIYEGYPDFYYKKDVEVTMVTIDKCEVKNIKAFVYIMDEKRSIGIPSNGYVQCCVNGYRDFGFDESYLIKALMYSQRLKDRSEYNGTGN